MLKFCRRIRYSSRSSGPFEGLEEDLQRVGRDVQVLRQREQRLAVQARHARCRRPRSGSARLGGAARPARGVVTACRSAPRRSGRRRAAARTRASAYSASAWRSMRRSHSSARPCALLGLEGGLLRLQLLDERGDVGLVGLPEQRHGGRQGENRSLGGRRAPATASGAAAPQRRLRRRPGAGAGRRAGSRAARR